MKFFRLTISILVLLSTSVFALSDQYINTSLPSSPLKKTGQTISYTDFDDGYYQIGNENSYTRSDVGVVTDNVTGLEWQDNESVSKTWTEASSYCSALSLDNGGWRLPSIKELQSIVDDGVFNPSINSVFQNITSRDYWSSTTSASNTSYALDVYFYSGNTRGYYKSNSLHVRCVRGGQ